MGVIANTLKLQLEELKRIDDELNREIEESIKRCHKLLENLAEFEAEN
jgi:hypothetical protein